MDIRHDAVFSDMIRLPLGGKSFQSKDGAVLMHNETNELFQYNAGHIAKSVETVLNARELADFLHISRAHAYNLLNTADFPTLHIGQRKFVTMENLQKWMEKHTNPLHNA